MLEALVNFHVAFCQHHCYSLITQMSLMSPGIWKILPWKVIILIHDKGLEKSHILGRLFYIFCLGWTLLGSLNFPFFETLLSEPRQREAYALSKLEYLAKLEKSLKGRREFLQETCYS